MIAEVTTAALMSENKHLANPCSTDSTPTSANQEDHVSMAAHAARRLARMNTNLNVILGVELICAAQGIGFRAPLSTSPQLQAVIATARAVIAPLEEDRYMAPDLDVAAALIGTASCWRILICQPTSLARVKLRQRTNDPEQEMRDMQNSRHNIRDIFPPTGSEISAKSWLTEAPMRMLMNNLHPDVAENPHALVVYGGIGRAARTWEDFDMIVATLRDLESDETLLVQSGKPVGVFRTHSDAPRVLIANSNLVPHWANWDHFNELDKRGLAMYGQMTAGSWIYIGTQGIVQGTYETFVEAAGSIMTAI